MSGNGHGSQIFTVPSDTSAIKWRVLSIEDGRVNLVSENTMGKNGLLENADDRLGMGGLVGLLYCKEELDNICSIYAHGEGADEGRSITLEDINKISGYDVKKDERYKDTYDTPVETAFGYKYRKIGISYSYNQTGLNLNTADTNKVPYKLIFDVDGCYWLPEKDLTNCEEQNFQFSILTVDSAGIGFVNDLFGVHEEYLPEGGDAIDNHGVRPVVTLKSTVKAGTSTTDANGITTWNMIAE